MSVGGGLGVRARHRRGVAPREARSHPRGRWPPGSIHTYIDRERDGRLGTQHELRTTQAHAHDIRNMCNICMCQSFYLPTHLVVGVEGEHAQCGGRGFLRRCVVAAHERHERLDGTRSSDGLVLGAAPSGGRSQRPSSRTSSVLAAAAHERHESIDVTRGSGGIQLPELIVGCFGRSIQCRGTKASAREQNEEH